MAKVSEEVVEYESDPEEGKRPLGMRRREAASDDEGGDGDEEEKPRLDRRSDIQSDESDGQGAAAEYEDDDEEDELDGKEEYEEEEFYEDNDEEEEDYDDRKENVHGGIGGVVVKEKGEMERRKAEQGVEVKALAIQTAEEEEEGKGEGEEEEKKENEPFAVPTAGAFYMHDDRFKDNAGGRNRRTYGGRKLWESKDDKKWGHDKFEEMTTKERHYEQGRRTSKSHYRGRGGKNRGPDNGYRRNRSKPFSNGDNQNQAAKGMRGRGSRKYDSLFNSGETLPIQNKLYGKRLEKTSHESSGRVPTPTSNTESDQVPPARKQSSLSSASPPFYPSGTSNNEISLSQKRHVQAGSSSRNIHAPVMDESFSMQQDNALLQGKNIADSIGINNLHIDDSANKPTAAKPLNNVRVTPRSSSFNTMLSTQSSVEGRDVAISGQMTYQTTSSRNQVNRVSSAMQLHPFQRSPQGRVRPAVQSPNLQFGQRLGSRSQASSPPKTAFSMSSSEPREVETNSEPNKSRNGLVGKGKASIQQSERGSFLYGGGQVMGATGNVGGGRGDQKFPASAFLPVMQFGSQHRGGIGVPAVGMAFPGYVAPPQHGLGNSEMTWLPVLAGAAGALGATYCSPYIAVDGSYHTPPSGQTSSLGTSSKENNTNKTSNEWKASHRHEVAGDEFGQRQKPRRYSEMDFKQPSTSA